ncbi:MAG: thioredoxin-disulfide reductase [Nitrospiraceae bacterium]|nr:thioredoxin-disulfide reductase [Nitrospiraceae bacterium]
MEAGLDYTEECYDVIIVGGGPAGLTAGLYCQRAALKTLLIEKGLAGGQLAISKEVENYPGMQGITGFELAEKMLRHAESFGLEVMRREVTQVEAGADVHTVRLAGGETLRSLSLILALGGTVRKLGIPGEAEYLGSGVSYCATCDGFFFKDKTVAVVGGGDTAAEEALYLAKLAKKVYHVHRKDELRASRLLQGRLKAEPVIEPVWNTVLTQIEGDETGVRAVALENIKTGEKGRLQVEGVFIFIGYAPNNALIPPGVRMNEQGFVITDDKCETNVAGVFVAGDLRQKYANQIVIAAADGCTAALAAAHYVEGHKGMVPRHRCSHYQA